MKRYLLVFVLALALFMPAIGSSHVAVVQAAAAPFAPTLALSSAVNARLALNPFTNLPLAGRARLASQPTSASGTFTGRAAVRDFGVRNGHLVAHVLVEGSVISASGKQQAVHVLTTATAAVSGTCQVLTLVLGALHLDLLGLVVDLNQVTLTITGEQGPGELLGNLVCAIANLLNQTPPSTVQQKATALNNLHTAVRQQLGRLTSTFVADPAGTLVQNVVMSSTVVATTTAMVSATCQVLTLDLGALHLDLLGLVVDLSPLHLTITAQAGSGKLLGNLLCDIANLLNGGGAHQGAVAKLLNLLFGLLPIHLLPIPLLLL